MTKPKTAPWKNPKPKSTSQAKLTPQNLAWAKAPAEKAGRRYPNLVDNMAATRRQNAAQRKEEPERSRP